MNKQTYKIFRTFNSTFELHIAKGVLKNNGIESFTADENLDIIIGTAIAEGYKLYVNSNDLEVAQEIFESIDKQDDIDSNNTKSKTKNNIEIQHQGSKKILINLVTFLILAILIIFSFSQAKEFLLDYFNFSNIDKFNTIISLSTSLIFIISGIGIFLRKQWSWYIFCSILLSLFLQQIFFQKSSFWNYSSFSFAISILVQIILIYLYTRKSVLSLFNIVINRKSIIIVSALAITFIAINIILTPKANKEIVSYRYLVFRGDTAIYNGQAFTGQIKHFHNNGTLETQGYFVKGLEKGSWKEYYDNQQISVDYFFIEGKLNGPIKEYYKNGMLKKEGYALLNKKDAICKEYLPDGTLVKLESYKDGTENGRFAEYYPNGQIYTESFFSDGLRIGQYRQWNLDGSINTVGYYKNNHKDSIWTLWSKHKIYLKETYKNGTLNGKAEYYDKEGYLLEYGHYISDKKDGQWFKLDLKGNITTIYHYKNDRLVRKVENKDQLQNPL